MKDHLLKSLVDLLLKDYPEFCIRFVVEYAPQLLVHLQHKIESSLVETFDDFDVPVPKAIADRYLWKGKWGAADMDHVGVPLTQCAVEGINKWLGQFTTLGKLEVVTTYIPHALDFVKNNAQNEISQAQCEFALLPTPRDSDWREGQKLSKTLQILGAIKLKGESGSWLVPSKKLAQTVCDKLQLKDTSVKEENVVAFQRAIAEKAFQFRKFYSDPTSQSPGGFETELKLIQSFYVLEPREGLGEYLKFACLGCPVGMRKAKCKHAIGLALALCLITVPAEKSFKVIKRQKCPGRPPKPKAAWEMQSSASEDEASDEENRACVVCDEKTSGRNNQIIFCDNRSCDLAYHQKCVGLNKLPKKRDSWFCPDCSEG
jgi:hypothetical protein